MVSGVGSWSHIHLKFAQKILNYISNYFLNTYSNINVIFGSLKLILNDGFGEDIKAN